MSTTTVPSVTLNDGRSIPQLGFGIFQVEPGDTAENVRTALEIGYRHVDGAQLYHNEAEAGAGIADSSVGRDDIFITTKLDNTNHAPDDVARSFEASLEAWRTDHLDLFLIHWPLPTRYGGDFISTWKAMEKLHADGRARSIGVSNFQVPHLQRLAAECDTAPAVDQVESHPYLLNEAVRQYCAEQNITLEAWSPIAEGKVLKDETITAIADRVGKTTAQVVLRWHLQRGDVIFPKSMKRARQEENFDLFGFELSQADLDTITALDQGEAGRTGPNPDTFDTIAG